MLDHDAQAQIGFSHGLTNCHSLTEGTGTADSTPYSELRRTACDFTFAKLVLELPHTML